MAAVVIILNSSSMKNPYNCPPLFSPRIIITEAYSPSLDKVAKYYGTGETQGTHLSVNYEIMNKFGPTSNARDMEAIVNNYMKSLPNGKWSSWMVRGLESGTGHWLKTI